MWARIHLIPALQAEEDRDQVRRYLADKAREKELLGSETKVYNSDRYVAEWSEPVNLPANAVTGSCDPHSPSRLRTRPSRADAGDLRTKRGSYVYTKAKESNGEICLQWLLHLGNRATMEFVSPTDPHETYDNRQHPVRFVNVDGSISTYTCMR
jgi:hypothetical protein